MLANVEASLHAGSIMYAQSRRDWAAFVPASIPTKTHTPQLERWCNALGSRALRVVDIGCGAGNIQIDEQVEASSCRRPDQRARFYYVTWRCV